MSALPNSVPDSRSRLRRRQNDSAVRRLSRRRQSVPTETSQRSEQLKRNSYTARLWESGMVLGMNAVLIGTALVTLVHLVPYQMTQQAKLKEVNKEKAQVSQNLQKLQQDYERSQSPDAAQRIAEEQGNLMKANQKRIFWLPQPPTSVQ